MSIDTRWYGEGGDPAHEASGPPRAPLTARQVEILTWVREGKSAWEIGKILGISGRSVDGHLRRIYARLDVRTRLQAVLKAQDLGLLLRRSRVAGDA